MNYTIKCMKLDLLLLKPYLKSMLLVLLVPLLITFFTGTLFEGLSFAATVMAMTTGYTFSVVEKNNLDRFYGFLPVKRNALVLGRYLIIFLTGFAALVFTLLVQVIILNFKTSAPSPQEIVVSFLSCAALFCIYACVQIPGYYRFGSIKGKMFMFIPTVGFLLFYYLVKLLTENKVNSTLNFVPNNMVLIIGAIGMMVLIVAISAIISTRIVEKGNH
ncbi:ABC-2 transporter permease [Clostridioides sp. ES-S-0108-01]|uniref:ABC-2 transporter permease n=1 Tax=Clostridioides sp. ES-S-0108-01 TaxID=2770773 RepID=UPI001D0C24E6|nr:ABC-2 transporter permease [Clostridioides sp. ES-S-0108-01]UDN51759.1 ABC-2 transporter permease [Clostridioides sp. ES-S-0107-01]